MNQRKDSKSDIHKLGFLGRPNFSKIFCNAKFSNFRPTPVGPQPPVDSKAAKCDPKVCRLPDCYCGGKEVPGRLKIFYFYN